MTRPVWDRLLSEVRKAHAAHADLTGFCAFPTDLSPQDVHPFHVPPADLLTSETGLTATPYVGLRDAIIATSPHAQWRETYKDTDIGDDFMSRFGCYCLIGDGGAFHSDQMRAWIVYMPARLPYPFHHHPAEETYLILAGKAVFHAYGTASKTLRAGDTVFHTKNQPHATETHDQPMLALVLWRNGFDAAPILTPQQAT